MEQKSELRSEGKEKESSIGVYNRVTFATITHLSDAIDYYPPVLRDSTEAAFTDLNYKALVERFEVEGCQLTIETLLGKGFFGHVHKGKLASKNEAVTVAVKMPKKDSTDQHLQRNALRGELLTMAYLQKNESNGHENILKLVGAITISSINFCILTEFCDMGSLDKFLCEKYDNDQFQNELIVRSYEEMEPPSDNEDMWKIHQDADWNDLFQERRNAGIITTSDLLWFALQIARGMQFLTDMKVVHRDMALRNILLKSDFTVKVADFGLSRRLFHGDESYNVLQNRDALPLRYMAPESLMIGHFSIHSECWSFGVVVWELFTFAKLLPYSVEDELHENIPPSSDFSAGELAAGHHLTIPSIVPKALKNLVTELWNEDPKNRPSFETCRKTIRKVLMNSCPQILECSSPSDDSNACEISLLSSEKQSIERSTGYKKWKSPWLLKLIILSITLIVFSAVVSIVIFLLLSSHEQLPPTTSSDHITVANGSTESTSGVLQTSETPDHIFLTDRTVRWIPGVDINNAILLHPMPELNGVIMILNSSVIVFINFISQKNNILFLGNVSREYSYSNSKLLSATIYKHLNKIYYICLHEDKNANGDRYFIASYEQKEIGGKPVQGIISKYLEYGTIEQRDVTTFTKKLYTDEYNRVFCIFSGWQTTESGMEETIFFVYQIFIKGNGEFSTEPLNGMQPGNMTGKYFAPFFRENKLHWPFQQMTIYNSTTIIQGTKIIKIDLSNGKIDDYKHSNFQSDLRPYPILSLQLPIHFKYYVCYFATFKSIKESALFCPYSGLYQSAHKWNIFSLKGVHALINYVVISSIHDENGNIIYLHGYTETNEPFFEIIDFNYLVQVHNPFIVPLHSEVNDIWINESTIEGKNITSICLLPDGTKAFFSIKNSGAIFSLDLNSSTKLHTVSNITSIPSDEEIEQIYTLRRNSSTYIISVMKKNLKKNLLLKAFKINDNSMEFIDKLYLGTTYKCAIDQKYLTMDDNGALHFITYTNFADRNFHNYSYMCMRRIDVAENETISTKIFIPNNDLALYIYYDLRQMKPFVFKTKFYLVHYSSSYAILKLIKTTKKDPRMDLANSLDYLKYTTKSTGGNDIYWLGVPVVIEDLVFTYVLRRINRDGIGDLGQLVYLDMNRQSWFAIEHTGNITLKAPVTLMRSDDYKIYLYGLGEDESGSLKPLIKIIDVKEVVQMQKNRSFLLDGVEPKWSYRVKE